MNTNFCELNNEELEDVNGGISPIEIAAGCAAAYGAYEVANGIWEAGQDFYSGYSAGVR